MPVNIQSPKELDNDNNKTILGGGGHHLDRDQRINMEHLVIGLYFLALFSCCLCLWFWYELESTREDLRDISRRTREVIDSLESLGKPRR